jgi:hypothetical protein
VRVQADDAGSANVLKKTLQVVLTGTGRDVRIWAVETVPGKITDKTDRLALRILFPGTAMMLGGFFVGLTQRDKASKTKGFHAPG